ncbi:hypothetical protein ACU4GD_00660 [Cupriavidus basilensis]
MAVPRLAQSASQAEGGGGVHRAGPNSNGCRGFTRRSTRPGRVGEIDYVFSESVSNADSRARAAPVCRAGSALILGESFAVEAAARKVAKDHPKTASPDGLLGQAAGAEFLGIRQLHPGACPTSPPA